MEFHNGDVVIFIEGGERQVAIRRGPGYHHDWVVATWGFRGMTDEQVRTLIGDGAQIIPYRPTV